MIVRGLYHAQASDLEMALLHQEHSCLLKASSSTSRNRPGEERVQFGVAEDRRYIRGFGPRTGRCFSLRVFPSRLPSTNDVHRVLAFFKRSALLG